jgi:hypothetical protein
MLFFNPKGTYLLALCTVAGLSIPVECCEALGALVGIQFLFLGSYLFIPLEKSFSFKRNVT